MLRSFNIKADIICVKQLWLIYLLSKAPYLWLGREQGVGCGARFRDVSKKNTDDRITQGQRKVQIERIQPSLTSESVPGDSLRGRAVHANCSQDT